MQLLKQMHRASFRLGPELGQKAFFTPGRWCTG
jgi:hypothetical protein